jgi:hypothetical protein
MFNIHDFLLGIEIMTTFEILTLLLSAANFGVIAFLTYRMTRANEAITKLQIDLATKELPKL